MTLVPRDGAVTVVEGGPVLHRSGWRPSVEAVTGLMRQVSSDEGEARPPARVAPSASEVHLPEGIVAKVDALPETPHVHHWNVALVLRDGSVVEDVEIGAGGMAIRRIGGNGNPDDVVDVLDSSTR
jgi:hypothetical protein